MRKTPIDNNRNRATKIIAKKWLLVLTFTFAMTLSSSACTQQSPLRANEQSELPKTALVSSGETKTDFTLPQDEFANYTAAMAKTSLNIRAAATTDSAVLATLTKGQSLPFIEQEGNWCKVKYKEGIGYLNTNYIANVQTSTVKERVIEAGLAKLGTKYQWGATRMFSAEGKRISSFTGNSFDCSSFVQYCFYIGAKVILGDYSGNQAAYTIGKKIYDYDELCRGDLVFTGTNGKISHVTIYLGQNLLLHAYSANGGPVSVTADGAWKSKFISARNVDLTVKNQYCSK